MIRFDSVLEAKTTINLSIGRILRMASRPSQEGDITEYYKCKAIIEEALEYIDFEKSQQNYASSLYKKTNEVGLLQ